jgi:hypothetical protein
VGVGAHGAGNALPAVRRGDAVLHEEGDAVHHPLLHPCDPPLRHEDGLAVPQLQDPLPDLRIGKDTSARTMELPVRIANNILTSQLSEPVSVRGSEFFSFIDGEFVALLMFKNGVFAVTTPYIDITTIEESVLHIKKLVYEEDNRLIEIKARSRRN